MPMITPFYAEKYAYQAFSFFLRSLFRDNIALRDISGAFGAPGLVVMVYLYH